MAVRWAPHCDWPCSVEIIILRNKSDGRNPNGGCGHHYVNIVLVTRASSYLRTFLEVRLPSL